MKYLFLLLILVGTNSFAQQKPVKKATAKKKYYTPPPIIKSPELREEAPPFPQSFAWQINADTTIAPNVIFREVIEISGYRVESRVSYKDEAVQLKKTDEKDGNVEESVRTSIFSKLTSYDSKISKGILTVTDKDSKQIRTFKVFYDKDKSIKGLQDVKTKKLYEITSFEGRLPSM